jgi:hypothetical protein
MLAATSESLDESVPILSHQILYFPILLSIS